MKNKSLFSIALLISISLWVQLKLSNKYNETINIPIQIINVPNDNYIVSKSFDNVPTEFYGKGFDLIKLRYNRPLFIIDAKTNNKRKNIINLTEEHLVYNDNNNVTYQKVNGDSKFEFTIDKYENAKKLVKIQFKSQADEDFFLKNKLVITPKTVKVSGPAYNLKKIRFILTEKISRIDVKDNSFDVKLAKSERLRFEPETVKINIEKTEIITKYITLIPISIPNNFDKTIVPQKVSVLIQGPKQIIKDIKGSNIRVNLDQGHLNKEFAEIKFNLPSNVELLDYSPKKVKIIENE